MESADGRVAYLTGAAELLATLDNRMEQEVYAGRLAEEIGIDKFIRDVLPTATGLELFMENRFSKNMMSLIAPQDKSAPSMFKWANGFSWAYTGNMADSDIRENVKAAGGKVDGVEVGAVLPIQPGGGEGGSGFRHARRLQGDGLGGVQADETGGVLLPAGGEGNGE